MQLAERIPQSLRTNAQQPERPTIIIVGAGPVGVRAVQEVSKRNPAAQIVLFGNESRKPYNRALLTSLLFQGSVDEAALTQAMDVGGSAIKYCQTEVISIDRHAHTVTDALGGVHNYSALILAMGSNPSTPSLPGINLPGIYTFHTKQDLEQVLSFHTQSRRTLILGGSVLGLEIALAVKQRGSEVIVLNRSAKLMSRFLDQHASALLENKVRDFDIDIMLNEQIAEVEGKTCVTGALLASGKHLDCDCIILAMGIWSNTELAANAGLDTAQGITVDDCMRTSDADIFAIGDCAQHRGTIYGLLAPGFEQASVAVQCALGASATYPGSTSITRVKMGQKPLIIVGERVDVEVTKLGHQELVYSNSNEYRKLVLYKGALIGATLIGSWELWGRLQEAMARRRRLTLWDALIFRLTGTLWKDPRENQVGRWPEQTLVCNCMNITRGELSQAVAQGCSTVAAISSRTGAGTVCKSCLPMLAELAGQRNLAQSQPQSKGILVSSILVLGVIAVFLSLAPFQPAQYYSQNSWQWDPQSRNIYWDQITGFTILGLILCSFTLLLRKRWRRLKHYSYESWRTLHGLIGVLSMVAVVIHTGLHLGFNFNAVVLITFIMALASGAAAGVKVNLASKHISLTANKSLVLWSRIHTLVLWPMSAFLGFHILSSYYY